MGLSEIFTKYWYIIIFILVIIVLFIYYISIKNEISSLEDNIKNSKTTSDSDSDMIKTKKTAANIVSYILAGLVIVSIAVLIGHYYYTKRTASSTTYKYTDNICYAWYFILYIIIIIIGLSTAYNIIHCNTKQDTECPKLFTELTDKQINNITKLIINKPTSGSKSLTINIISNVDGDDKDPSYCPVTYNCTTQDQDILLNIINKFCTRNK